jgi:hypothetical protein
MVRNFFLILLFFTRVGFEKAYAQNGGDSAQNEISADSLNSESGDSVETLKINPYSLYRLTSRSGHLSDNHLRQVDSQQVRSYQLNPDYAYSNDSAYWKKPLPSTKGAGKMLLDEQTLQRIFIGLMAALVVFGVYLLAKENSFTWLSRKNMRILSMSESESSEKETDFTSAIEKYQREGNYRMAVRSLYLKALQEITEKTGIRVPDSSTNAEIALAIGSHGAGADFQYLYKAYEYIFYGDFTPSPELYGVLRKKFEEFQKSLSA